MDSLNYREIDGKIDKLIRKGEFSKAYKLALNYPQSAIIQSERMEILIRQEEYAKAKVLGNRKEFFNATPVQSKNFKIALRENDNDTIKKIGNRKAFENNSLIQVKFLKWAMKQGEDEIIAKIANNKNFKDDQQIQGKLIQYHISNGNLDKAKNLATVSAFKDNPVIQSLLVEIYVQEGNFEQARKIVKKDKIKSHPFITKKIEEHPELKKIEKKEEKVKEEKKKVETKIELIETVAKKAKVETKQEINQNEKIQETKAVLTEKIKSNTEEKEQKQNKQQIVPVKDSKVNVDLEYVRHIIRRLEKYKIDVYKELQTKDITIQTEATKKWDKLETLIDSLTDCLNIMTDKRLDKNEKKSSEEIIKSMCERFKKLEEKERRHANGERDI